jgi:hypothetical protein
MYCYFLKVLKMKVMTRILLLKEMKKWSMLTLKSCKYIHCIRNIPLIHSLHELLSLATKRA